MLAGDVDCLLVHRLEVFAGVSKQLVGLLTMVAEGARDAGSAQQLHAVWPQILDYLLPSARNLRASDTGRGHPYDRDVDELDRTLLLVPGPGVDFWPWSMTVALAGRWLEAFTGRADMADRAIIFSDPVTGVASDQCARFSLRVLGEDAQSIRRESRMAVAFLEQALRNPPSGSVASKARSVLDGLAATVTSLR